MPEFIKIDWDEILVNNRSLAVINSTEPEYRLSWRIERDLGISFERVNDLSRTFSKGKAIVHFAAYDFENPVSGYTLKLIKNREGNAVFYEKLANIEYILIGTDYDAEDWSLLIQKLSGLEGVLLCQDLSLPAYLSDPYLLF
jgi:hypothetical protein